MTTARREPAQASEPFWEPVSTTRLIVASSLLGLLALIILFNRERGFIAVLDHANLAFHEAGHLFYGIFGQTLALYGGTLGQLTFPLIAAGIFTWRRDLFAAALCGAWVFENLFNIARYMADARAQVLPLVGGGGHDWAFIFSRWQALQSDRAVAAVTRGVGWVGLGALFLGLLLAWRRDRRAGRHERSAPG